MLRILTSLQAWCPRLHQSHLRWPVMVWQSGKRPKGSSRKRRMQRWHQPRRRRGAVLSTLWPLGGSLRPPGGGGGAPPPPREVWPAAGRTGVAGATAEMLLAEKKMVREDERARRRRGARAVR